ncbi:MAG: type II secretion system protein GspE [Nitrospirae bacterium]|nr:MAG: type II secretion system protein GspE [Nitrospirota bacterium]
MSESLEPEQQKRRRKLGSMLADARLVTQDQLEQGLQESLLSSKRLGETLVQAGVVTEEALARCLSSQLGFPFVDLAHQQPDSRLTTIIPETLAKRYQAVPIRLEGKTLIVAMADPLDFRAIQDLSFRSGCAVKPVIGTLSAIQNFLEMTYPEPTLHSASDGIPKGNAEEYNAALLEIPPETTAVATMEAESIEETLRSAPVVRLGSLIMSEAVASRASDIHMEPTPTDTVVRYRIDGMLRQAIRLPKAVHASLVSRFKVLSKIDIAERRLPQDGSLRVHIESRDVDFRVSTMPTQYGEKMVLRIMDESKAMIRLDTLGMSESSYAHVASFTQRRKGILLVTGPTGSGKTTTLYALIHALKSSSLNLITIEDPIESSIQGINQTQINPAAGLTFASALRAILRQDPDVILVGEIRDLETAEIAVRAAMTGHLVLSTLHTNDAPSAVTRLIDLGIPRYLVASLIEGIIAQRLVRKICQDCKKERTPSPAALKLLKIQPEALASVTFYAGEGCDRCAGTGYWGRATIMEILDPTARMREMISAEASEQDLRLAALAAKMTSLGEDGLNKTKAGVTTIEELLRVIEVSNKTESICPGCAHIVQYDFHACPFCERLLNRTCQACRRPLQLEWKLCPYCGTHATRV